MVAAPADHDAGGRPDQARLLRAYVADHLQLLRACHDLACRVRRRAGPGGLGDLLDAVATETRHQEAIAHAFLRQLGAGSPWLRILIGSLTERVGRLKPNGRFFRASPLAPVFELEVLEALLDMTTRFWRALDHAGTASPDVVRPLADAAQELARRLEHRRLEAGDHALTPLGAT